MSSSIKRQNHRIYPCNASRKNELLTHLAARHNGQKILVVTAGDPSLITVEGAELTVLSDEQLSASTGYDCDILISYDLPEKAIVYMTRLSRSREYALILLDAEDQKRLYGIETLLGRTIIQETVPGFEPDFGIAAERQSKEEAKARRAARDETFAKEGKESKRDARGERNDKRPARKPFVSAEEKSSDKWARKNTKPRFIGKDENGKPMFEGKTRDRNHYIDGTPRTEAEKAYKTPYGSKPKFFGKDQKPAGGTNSSEGKKESFKGEKKPFGDKKPYGEKRSYDDKKSYGDKKPAGDKKAFGDKKPYGDKKPFGDKKPSGEKKGYGDKKPFGGQKSFGDKKPSEAPAQPKRPPRRIDVKSFKPSEKKA